MANNNLDVIISVKDNATKALGSLTKTVGKLGIAMAGVAAAFTAAVGVKAVKDAAAFEARMGNVATLVNTTRVNMDRLSEQVLEISKQVPVTNAILSEGLYQTISAGITDTDDAMNVLNQSAKLGVAGLADTGQAVDLMTSAINAFGLDAKDAEKVSDTLFTTVRLGKTTVAELAGSFGNAAPIASAAGVSFEELQSAAAALTTAGQDTATAYTNLKGVFTAVVKPSDDAMKAAEELGIEFSVAALESKGLVGFLQDIEEATGGDIEMMARLFPNVRALSAALALTGAQSDLMASNMDEMTKAGGATEEAFRKQNETFNAQYQILKNNLGSILIKIGNVFLPDISTSLKSLNDFISQNEDKIVSLVENGYNKLKDAIKIITDLFKKAKEKTEELTEKYSKMTDFLKLVFAPGIVIAMKTIEKFGLSIWDVIAIVGFMINPIRAIIFWIGTRIVKALDDEAIEAIGRFIGKIKEWISLVSDEFIKWISNAIDIVIDFADAIWGDAIEAINGIIDVFVIFKDKILELFIGSTEDAKNKSLDTWDKIREKVDSVVSFLKDDLFPAFMEKINLVKDFITDLFEENKEPLDNLKASIDELSERFSPLFDVVKSVSNEALKGLIDVLLEAIRVVFPVVLFVIDLLIDTFTRWSDIIIENKEFFINFVKAIKTQLEILVKAFEISFDLLTKPVETLERALEKLKDIMGSVKSYAKNKLKDVFGFADGGIVPQYFASGGEARGTDTVPAMLTPGELILNKSQQKNLAGGMGGVTINIQGNFVGNHEEAERFGNMIVRKLGLSTAMI